MKKLRAAIAALAVLAGEARANPNDINLDNYRNFSQGQVQGMFSQLSEQVGLGINFIPLAPADPSGITGFDIGVELTGLPINKDADYWKAAMPADVPDYLVVPKLSVQKGLPWGLDIGVIYSMVPNSNIRLLGAELKYAILDGGIAVPALAIRASYTTLMGVPWLSFQTERLDLSISKGLWVLTPYAGIGGILMQSHPNIPAGFPNVIKDENITEGVAFGGLKISIFLVKLTLEADYARYPSYNAKFSVGF